MIILIAQIVLAIVVFVYIGDLQTATAEVLTRLWNNRNNQGNLQIWDNIQTTVSFTFKTFFFFWISRQSADNLQQPYDNIA